jgi:hypothetical protein
MTDTDVVVIGAHRGARLAGRLEHLLPEKRYSRDGRERRRIDVNPRRDADPGDDCIGLRIGLDNPDDWSSKGDCVDTSGITCVHASGCEGDCDGGERNECATLEID